MAPDDSSLPRQMPLKILLDEKHKQLLAIRKENQSFPLRPASLPYVHGAICISCLRLPEQVATEKLFIICSFIPQVRSPTRVSKGYKEGVGRAYSFSEPLGMNLFPCSNDLLTEFSSISCRMEHWLPGGWAEGHSPRPPLCLLSWSFLSFSSTFKGLWLD